MKKQPALSVVVYRLPGPDDNLIQTHTIKMLQSLTVCGTGGGLAYITLHEPDFDRIWNGVSQGDALGTAYAILGFLGPEGQQFIGRHGDFIFGWVGGSDEAYGDLLLLQIIPQPRLLAAMN